MKKEQVMEWVKRFFWIICAVLVVRAIFIPIHITGSSMKPTIDEQDELIMTRFGKVKRFDIVVFETQNGERYIKRVVGLPGETLTYKNDQLYINHQSIAEPFLKENKQKFHRTTQKMPYTSDFTLKQLLNISRIPQGYYFVMGDNRRFSKDSRSIGLIEQKQLIGKVRGIYYPFNHLKLL